MSATKPIPADVMKTANSVYDALGRGSTLDIERIARAILDERERCAEIAEWCASAAPKVAPAIARHIREAR